MMHPSSIENLEFSESDIRNMEAGRKWLVEKMLELNTHIINRIKSEPGFNE
jgi:hypothetical protein